MQSGNKKQKTCTEKLILHKVYKTKMKHLIKNILRYGITRHIQNKNVRRIVNNNIDLSNKYQEKIFCIGFGKTGTTSLEHELKCLG